MNDPHHPKNILIVGAGSVGQVYGRHLELAGARVSFFVKEKYVSQYKQGFVLYPLNGKAKRKPIRFTPFQIYSDLHELQKQTWDQVYLCIPSTGLRGPWFETFCQAIGSATLISILPGLEDQEYILKFLPENQLVSGTVSLASYHAPLAHETLEAPGMAYWFFPMSPNQYSGRDESRVTEVVRLLNRGRFPAKKTKNIRKYLTLSIASTEALILAFEIGGWTLKGLKEKKLLKQACKASVEAIRVASKKLGIQPPWFKVLYQPALIKTILNVAPHLTPFSLEEMLRSHYIKVKAQTRFEAKAYIDAGLREGVGVDTLQQLYSTIAI